MPKVTSVKPQKKNPRRFNVFLDGEFAFGADEDLVVNRRLVVGKIIEQDDLEKILFEAEIGKLMEKIYRWFSIRQHSEKEVRDYFKIKNRRRLFSRGLKNQKPKTKNEEPISDLVVDGVIETLKKKEMINDLEFAKAWAESRRKSKQKGIRAIKMELFQKGISKEIIEEALRLVDTRSGQVSEGDLAKLALKKKMKAWKNLDSQKSRQKAFEFLMRKGFDYDLVKEVIEKAL